jgi:Na+/H+-dicarboxylate symporter
MAPHPPLRGAARATTNMIGNGMATSVVARQEDALDTQARDGAFSGKSEAARTRRMRSGAASTARTVQA